MTISEDQRVLLFLGAVIIIYILSAGILVRTVLSRINRRPRALTPLRRWAERSILLFAISGVLCMAYGFFLKPYWPAVTHIQITSANLPPNKRETNHPTQRWQLLVDCRTLQAKGILR